MRTKVFIQVALCIALVLMAACSEREVLIDTEFGDFEYIDSTQGPAIQFAPFANMLTRAVPTANDLEFYHQTFKVYGTKTNNDGQQIQPVFEGVTVTADIKAAIDSANTWTYNIDRYWDKQADNYQFVAFAPAHAPLSYQHNLVEVNDATASFFSQNDYVLIGQNLQEGAPTNGEKNKGFTGEAGTDCDVMRSDAVPVLDPATTPVVTFNFRHTLSKLMVTIKANKGEPYKIEIDSVCVADLYSSGKYDHTNGWEVKDSTKYVNYQYCAPDTLVSDTTKTYFIESLVMPQAISNTHIITLLYTIHSGGYQESFTYKANLADIFGSGVSQFVAGNSYTINFNIAPENNIITFDAGITAWTDGN